jgi:hypothetical protein
LSTSVQAGAAAVSFTASVTDALNTTINWEVNGVQGGNATVGTISSAGLYTPPATIASSTVVSISAVSAADPTRMASAQVTVTAPPPPPGSSSGGTSSGGSSSGSSGSGTSSGGTSSGGTNGSPASSAVNAAGSGSGGGGALDEATLALALMLAILRSCAVRRRPISG